MTDLSLKAKRTAARHLTRRIGDMLIQIAGSYADVDEYVVAKCDDLREELSVLDTLFDEAVRIADGGARE